ncbi:MAG: DUF1553 domain-containing protein [Phycisphaera sp.]|nr:DUF1553 domain-containing protein [Phycisphaera sp.]
MTGPDVTNHRRISINGVAWSGREAWSIIRRSPRGGLTGHTMFYSRRQPSRSFERCRYATLGAVFAAVSLCVVGAGVSTARGDDGTDFFEKRVRPLLVEACTECHGAKKHKAGLRLDYRSTAMKGGESGVAIVPGKPDESRLVVAVRYTDDDLQMPPKRKLTDDQVKVLEQWVATGAVWPAGNEPANLSTADTDKPKVSTDGPQLRRGPPDQAELDAYRAEHWSMKPVTKPTPPAGLKHEAWIKSPIDRFVVAKQEAAGIEPAEMADRRTLIRRAYFDLIGLPPTYEQVEAFVADKSPDAFAKVVDHLLAMPQYGERWGRHWLDVARYSDTKGYVGGGEERRYAFAWTYRDYVIDAFNADKPYDRFITEQLAADRLDLGDDKSALAAMGFLTVGRRFTNRINEIIDDRIDVITRGMLGLTVTCARCHDHKYDPIAMTDYYSLYGILRSSDEPDGDDMPVIAEPTPSPGYEKYKQEIAKRQKDLDDYVAKVHGQIAEELRSRAGDYLGYIARTLPKHKTGDVKLQGERGPLRPRGVERWRQMLLHNGRGGDRDPVWSPFHFFSNVDRDGFEQKAKEALDHFDEWEQKHGPINARLKAELLAHPPKSMEEVAKIYGRLLEESHHQWQELVKKDANATRLPDDAEEQLRQELYADGSPPVMSDDEAVHLFGQGERDQRNRTEGKISEYRAQSPFAPPRAMVLSERDHPHDPYVFLRGSDRNPGERVPRRFPLVLSNVDASHYATGGRLELARAITNPANPLTARVMVNRIWHHHFGTGLVRTTSDFGVRADAPALPQLLDYLAASFVESGWSIKKMHRMIMLSSVYQQASTIRPESAKIDPENDLLWRHERRRLEFEPMRDAMLAVAARLDLTVHGRPVEITNAGERRRSVYAYVDRQDLPNLFRAFDFASPDASSPGRPDTTVPQQALFMLNSPFVEQQVSGVLARPEFTSAPNRRDKAAALYRIIFSREPSDAEITLAESFIAAEDKAAWRRYVQALLLSNEFVFID